MKFKNTTVLVTGGAGFIGSHIVDSLVEEGANVIVYDNFSFGNLRNLDNSRGKIKVIKGDILDFPLLKKSMKNADFVSHHAAQLEIFRSTKDPFADLEINTLGTINVLRAAQENKVRKVINASSACVYGQPHAKVQDENHPTNPNWAYGISKLAAEKYCQISESSSGIPVTSLRYGIVYGPREWYRRVLTIFIKRAIEKKDLIIFGRGSQYRDFVYVGDVVRIHNLCLEYGTSDGQAINVGTGKPTTVRQLARLVITAVSPEKLKIISEKVAEGGESKIVEGKKRNVNDLIGMCLDSGKAHRLLGWQAKTDLSFGILQELNWARKNPQYWQKIKYTD